MVTPSPPDLRSDPFPVLRTARLVLRAPMLADAPALHALRSDERVMRHIGRPRTTTEEDAVAMLRDVLEQHRTGISLSWALTLEEGGPLLGTIGYYRVQPQHFRGEVGYLLHPDHWGRGLMGEALEAVIGHGFEAIGFHGIEAITDPDNGPSNRLLEKHGFRREGLIRENYFWNGRFYDSAIWCMLASDRRGADHIALSRTTT
ncbi:MAG: GNAT family N-acetyltransferase [Flavobacteriales bacterium]|nr:GNAT family N-acetyltransferase [Flavobacteriales bacterium]MCB9168528.1 GNAT family N-acetyltransferase [Flavobacteriales bacterium]